MQAVGSSCGTTLAQLRANPAPLVGQTFRVGMSQGPARTTGWLAWGPQVASWNGLTLPLDLSSSGMTGCSMFAAPEEGSSFFTDATGHFHFDWAVPNQAALTGMQLVAQAFFADPGANALGLGASNGMNLQIGNLNQVRTVTQIQHHAVTWRFDQPVQAGQYVNGDWWVLGPVAIVQITPASTSTSGPRERNGSMINPSPYSLDHGYDAAMYGSWNQGEYKRHLNAGLNVNSTSPLQLRPGETLVSTGSVPNAGMMPQLADVSLLTCVGQTPPADAFRPPYSGTNKVSQFREADLDYSVLLSLPVRPSAPTLASVERTIERVWLDHIRGWKGRFQHPVNHMPDYGRQMTAEIGVAALMLNSDFTHQQKRQLLIYFVQLGIDLHGLAQNGGHWHADGGHTAGRKLPILMAGKILNDPTMLGIGRSSTRFCEDGQTFRVAQTSPGVYNYGHGGYTAADVGLPEWGFAHRDRPDRDDKDWYGDPYRRCCTANCWAGHHLVVLAMGLKRDWNHDVYFDYVDRYMSIEPQGTWTRQWDRFTEDMWDAYRPMF